MFSPSLSACLSGTDDAGSAHGRSTTRCVAAPEPADDGTSGDRSHRYISMYITSFAFGFMVCVVY